MFCHIAKILNNINNTYRYIRSCLIRVNKIYAINGSKKENLYLEYLKANMRMCVTDKKYKLVKVEIMNHEYVRDLVFANITMSELIDLIYKVKFDANELLLQKKYIVTDIKLNSYGTVKKIFDHYADRSKIYNHSLRNMFLLKNIPWNDDDVIEVNYLKINGKHTNKFNISDVIDRHISELY